MEEILYQSVLATMKRCKLDYNGINMDKPSTNFFHPQYEWEFQPPFPIAPNILGDGAWTQQANPRHSLRRCLELEGFTKGWSLCPKNSEDRTSVNVARNSLILVYILSREISTVSCT